MPELTPEILNGLVKQISDSVYARRTPDEAARNLALIVGDDWAQAALERHRELARRQIMLRDPGAIIDRDLPSWYLGPDEARDKFWPAYKALLRSRNWQDEQLNQLDAASTKIVGLLSHPGEGSIRTRGLVLGHVQSGKTANYTAVIAKAADAGYRLFIVLSGMNNALRNQTQRRLNSDLSLASEDWGTITEPSRDFRENTNVNYFLADRGEQRGVLGVLKKHSGRLSRLRDWLAGAHLDILRTCPVLVIDDEADQATPNAHPDPEERTRINALIVEILRILPKAAYVGYTATPFANFFIDPTSPQDLYPRDFIVDLPRSADYFGPERIFGRDPIDGEDPDAVADGLDMIRIVQPAELPLLVPGNAAARFTFEPAAVPSLREAVTYFVLSTSARYARGQRKEHASMLIHTSQYSVVHDKLCSATQHLCDELAEQLRNGDAALLGSLRALWEREQAAVPSAEVGEQPTGFEVLSPFLADVLEQLELKVENGQSVDRVDYETADPGQGRVYIVIGGNVLSRGLTLEGLCVSYFIRTASAYDTLLQMGRWFGYRRGYADLPRIWMTEELSGYFYDLATVEREIRNEITLYENGHLTPLEVGVRIRTHPHLAITSKLKMLRAVPSSMSFSGKAEQALVYQHTDSVWLQRNFDAGRALVVAARQDGVQPRRLQDRPHHILTGVGAERILQFLEAYTIHEENRAVPGDLIRGYVRAQNARGRLRTWNVAIISRSDDRLGTVDIGLDAGVSLVNRARYLRGNVALADLKALLSEIDIAADLDVPTDELRGLSRPALLSKRFSLNPDRPLLLLYPISKDSVPKPGSRPERRPLAAAAHVLGLGLVFPQVADGTPQGYMTVDLSQVPREIADLEDIAEPDDVDGSTAGA